jgi:hypothetical protein
MTVHLTSAQESDTAQQVLIAAREWEAAIANGDSTAITRLRHPDFIG